MILSELFSVGASNFGTDRETNNKRWLQVGKDLLTQFKIGETLFRASMKPIDIEGVAKPTFTFGFTPPTKSKEEIKQRDSGQYGKRKDTVQVFSAVGDILLSFLDNYDAAAVVFAPETNRLKATYERIVRNNNLRNELAQRGYKIRKDKVKHDGHDFYVIEK